MSSNQFNSKFKPTFLYIKQHSVTGLMYFGKTIRNPETYLGSGTYWKDHVKKHGKEVINLWYCLFHDKEECIRFALDFSKQYNIIESDVWANLCEEDGIAGSNGWDHMTGKTAVVDNDGRHFAISTNDERFISGEVKSVFTNRTCYKDKYGNMFNVYKDDPRVISGDLVGIISGKVPMKDSDGDTMLVDKDDPRIARGELVGVTKGRKALSAYEILTGVVKQVTTDEFWKNKHLYHGIRKAQSLGLLKRRGEG